MHLLQQSKNFNKEIYVFTDDQKTTVVDQHTAEGMDKAAKLFDPNVRLFFVPLSDQPFENIGIEKVEIPPTLFQKGKPFTVRADVRNYGTALVENHLVNLFLDGVHVMQKSVAIQGGQHAFVDFTATPQHAGFNAGRVELRKHVRRRQRSLFLDRRAGTNRGAPFIIRPQKLNIHSSSPSRHITTTRHQQHLR